MNIIITGATSFIGIALIEKLVKEDCKIIAVVRPNSNRKSVLSKCRKIKIVEAELTEIDNLSLPSSDILFHIGWINDITNARFNLCGQLQNIDCANKAVECAKKTGCSVFLSVGSQAECGRVKRKISAYTPDNPENAYAVAKCNSYFQTKYLCEQYGIRHAYCRLLSAYGYYDRENTLISTCINACITKSNVQLTPCEQIWDYINVKDVVNALWLIAKNGKHGRKYPIGSGIGIPLREYIAQIAKICNYPQLLDGIGKKSYADNQIMNLQADLTELKDETGFNPKISFIQGIEEIWNQKKLSFSPPPRYIKVIFNITLLKIIVASFYLLFGK